MKHVVSVGLGSSTRDSYIETELLGELIIIERRGTNGSVQQAIKLIEELDGKVDAFGLGGTDLFIQIAGRRYFLRESLGIARHAKKTPLVCGAGLKDTLERKVIKDLDAEISWKDKKCLVVSAVDRFGMAETLIELGADVTLGDIIFLLGIDAPFKQLKNLARVARVVAPPATQLPIKFLYPTGESQEHTKVNDWRAKYFVKAELIAGDFHLIRRYAPEDLSGKIILTNTTTKDDLELLKARGVKMLITTTPRLNGRSLSTNMLEAAFVALAGKFPLEPKDYETLIETSGIKPDIQEF